MNLKFHCIHCGQRIATDDSMCGTSGTCPSCGGKVTVPSSSNSPNLGLSSPPSKAQPAVRPRWVSWMRFDPNNLKLTDVWILFVFFGVAALLGRRSGHTPPPANPTPSSQSTASIASQTPKPTPDPKIVARNHDIDDGLNKGHFLGQQAGRDGLPIPTAEELHSAALQLAIKEGASDSEAWALAFEKAFVSGYKEVTRKAFK